MVPVLTPAGYVISDDPARLQPAAVYDFLRGSYWAPQRSRETVERSLQHSLCLGIYAPDGAQVGLVRVVTDFATFAYLCDVYVLEAHRGQGLAKTALKAALTHPGLHGIRRISLFTADAHSLYASLGFGPMHLPERYMEKIVAAPVSPSCPLTGERPRSQSLPPPEPSG
jgi:ribosomal protein S18 acetylase RimI-like enzyme